MPSAVSILRRVLSRRNDANLRFSDLVHFLLALGFDERIKGDHHIFTRTGMVDIMNLQPERGNANQVRQVRAILVRYGLGGELDDEA
ncbi:MAG TPA: type II toxin-antitoxin system HicA family toxin [Dehalococcoidia bacterium]|jgi:hypothetical protein|nr:type II toxin-antitoxin system HicA family toxin [Dehalococcoidia bacterium]